MKTRSRNRGKGRGEEGEPETAVDSEAALSGFLTSCNYSAHEQTLTDKPVFLSIGGKLINLTPTKA